MKRVLFAAALLFVTNIIAQSQPSNYDGGSDLQKAILNAKKKKTISTTKKKTATTAKKETIYIPETADEKLYRLKNGHSSPDYVRRVTANKAYQDEVAENNRTEAERIRVSNERKRTDSLARVQEQQRIEKLRKESFEKMKCKQDSINKKNQADRDAYIQKQKEEQSKNR